MGSLKMFFGIFVIVAGLYVSFKVIPPYFNNYQFEDWLKQEATQDSYSPKTADDIRDTVVKKAQEYDIPLTADGVQVQRSGNQYSGTVAIHAPYVIHVDLPGFPFDMHFNASTENKGVF